VPASEAFFKCLAKSKIVVVYATHQAKGSKTYRRATKAPKGRHTEYKCGSLKNHSTKQHLDLTLSQELILVLILTKVMLNLRI